MNIARGVGGRSLLGPLRQAATAQALKVVNKRKNDSRAILRFAMAYGAACLIQLASSVALATHPARSVPSRRRRRLSSNA